MTVWEGLFLMGELTDLIGETRAPRASVSSSRRSSRDGEAIGAGLLFGEAEKKEVMVDPLFPHDVLLAAMLILAAIQNDNHS